MYHVIVSFAFPQYYFFAETVKTIHLEQVMYGILKFDLFMLTIINYTHTYRSPAAPTDSQKKHFSYFELQRRATLTVPLFSNTSYLSHLGIWPSIKLNTLFKKYSKNIQIST